MARNEFPEDERCCALGILNSACLEPAPRKLLIDGAIAAQFCDSHFEENYITWQKHAKWNALKFEEANQ